MEEQQRNIDEVFRQSLGDYRESPPGAVWQDIVSRLDEEDGRRRKGFFLRWPWVALSLLLIVSGTMMVVGLNKNNDGGITKISSAGSINTTQEVSAQNTQQTPILSAGNIESNPQTEQPLQAEAHLNPEVAQVVPMGVAAKPAPVSQLVSNEPAQMSYMPASPLRHIPVHGRTIEVTPTPVAMPAPPVVMASRKPEALAKLSARNAKVTAEAPRVAPAGPSARQIEKDRIPVIIAERKPVTLAKLSGRNTKTTTTLPPTIAAPFARKIETDRIPVITGAPKPEVLARLSARNTKATTPVPGAAVAAPVARNIERDRIPVIAAEPKQADAPQNIAWTKPAPELIRGIAAAEARGPVHAARTNVPETLYADNSPLPAAYVIGEKREIIPEDEPEVIPQSQPVSVPVKNSQPGKTVTAMPIPASAIAVAPPVKESDPLPVAVDKTPEQSTPSLNMPKAGLPISLAALIGYEHGFNAVMQSRYTASMRLLWHASQTIAIGLQPAFRFGNLATTNLTDSRSYYRSSVQVDSFHTYDNSPTVRYAVDSIYNYVVHETYDSIFVQGSSVSGSFWELEIPLVVRYNLNKSWYTYGGPSINIGGKVSYNAGGNPQVYTTIRKDSLAQSEQLPIAAFNGYFGKSSLEAYDSYKPAQSSVDPTLRLGYMFGVGYTWKNIMAEASVHQQLSGYDNVPAGLKDVYATPNVRVSVGYLLFAPKHRATGIAE